MEWSITMFEHFWTHYTELPDGYGFAIFDSSHIAWLIGIVIGIALATVLFCRLPEKGRRIYELVLGNSLLVLEVVKDLVLAIDGKFEMAYLPLHLCGLSLFVCAAYSIWRGKMLGELLYCICMPGALAALIFPNWTGYSGLNFYLLHSYIVHAMIVLYPIMLIAAGKFKPNPKMLPWCMLSLVAVAIPLYFFNKVFDTNFLFVNYPSPGSPLVFFESLWGNPGYLFGFPIIIAGVWLVLYLPCLFIPSWRKALCCKPEVTADADC